MKVIRTRARGLLWPAFILAMLIAAGSVSFTITPKGDMPEPEAEAFWKYISSENPYTEWDHWPGFEEMYEGQSPHGAYLKLYVNKNAETAIQDGKKMMPEHAIIVKENYNKDKELVAITPMYKVEGYNPDAGNWFWAKYGTDGKVMAAGKVTSCIECHKKAMQDDYLFTTSKD